MGDLFRTILVVLVLAQLSFGQATSSVARAPGASVAGETPSTFSDAYAKALKANPADLTLDIETTDNHTAYRSDERINLKLKISSSSPGKYRAELTDRGVDELIFRDAAGKTHRMQYAGGIAYWQDVKLTIQESVTVETSFEALRLLPTFDRKVNPEERPQERRLPPGEYDMYVQTHRVVYMQSQPANRAAVSGGLTSRNLLHLVILPDDVVWREDDIRGSLKLSEDGRTHLVLANDNDGKCLSPRVDGKAWSHPVGKAGLIKPGKHSLSCNEEFLIDVPDGFTYTFVYWGK